MELLKIENLCKIYGSGKNQVTALDHVSLTIEKGNLLQLSELPAPANPRCSTSSAA